MMQPPSTTTTTTTTTTTSVRVKRGPRAAGAVLQRIIREYHRCETRGFPHRSRKLNKLEDFSSRTCLQRLPSFAGRGDFVGGIDNEALDFSQLEDFINSDSEQVAT